MRSASADTREGDRRRIVGNAALASLLDRRAWIGEVAPWANDLVGLEVAELEVAELEVAELEVAELEVAELEVAELEVAELEVAGLEVAAIEVFRIEAVTSRLRTSGARDDCTHECAGFRYIESITHTHGER
jgi:hypothetical protein